MTEIQIFAIGFIGGAVTGLILIIGYCMAVLAGRASRADKWDALVDYYAVLAGRASRSEEVTGDDKWDALFDYYEGES